MKQLVTVVWLFLGLGWCAQAENVPAHPTYIFNIINDSARVNLLNHRAAQILSTNPQRAASLAEEAKALSELLQYEYGRVNSLVLLGKAYQAQKEYTTALDNYLQASKALENSDRQSKNSQVLMDIGLLFRDWGAYEKSVVYLEQAYQNSLSAHQTKQQMVLLNYLGETHILLNNRQKAKSYYTLLLDLHKLHSDKTRVLEVMDKVAEIYTQLGQREQALEYELQVLRLKKELGMHAELATSLNKIGNLYKNLNNNVKALGYYKESLSLNERLGPEASGSRDDDVLMNIAFIYQAKGDYNEALDYLFDALEIRRTRGDYVGAAVVNHEIAYTYMALGKLKPAQEYAEMAVTWAEREKSYEVLVNSYKILSDIYLNDGDDENALKYYKRHTEIMRQLYMAQNKQKQKLLEKQLEIERKEQEAKLLLIDKEMKELELKELQYRSDKKESDIALLKKEKELQDASLQMEQALKEKAEQDLLLSQQSYEAEKNNREMRIQSLRLSQSELEEKERQKTIALLKERKALQESELAVSQAMRTFFFGLSVLFAIILFLIYRSYRLKKKANTSLALQNMEIQQQKDILEQTLKELKAAHSQIVQSEKMASLGELTAGIAHEINNPINFVYAGVDGLRVSLEGLLDVLNKYEELDDSQSIQEIESVLEEVKRIKNQLYFDETKDNVFSVVNAIKEGASRTAEIVKGLRSFSRLDETELKKANIHEGIDSTLILLNSRISEDHIKIEKQYDPRIPEIECFPGQLNQVFMNLISNAIESIEDEGTVIIQTKDLADSVQISILDTGKGMSEEIKSKIFQPFFTTKGPGEGTGLGLSITFGIIDKHHGKITVDSKKGQGTIFRVTIPKKQQEVLEPVA